VKAPEIDIEQYVRALHKVDNAVECMMSAGPYAGSLGHAPNAGNDSPACPPAGFFSELFETNDGKELFACRKEVVGEGASVVALLRSEEYDAAEIKQRLEDQVKIARAHGLSFYFVCCLWLLECGLDFRLLGLERKESNLSRFLNRILGLQLKQQQYVSQYFYAVFDQVVKDAKLSGEYDLGIKTYSGREVKFASSPRVFCYGGVANPTDMVYLYHVKQDMGIDSKEAKRIYLEAAEKDGVDSTDTSDDWNRRGANRFVLKTGFYIDDRPFLKKTPKVFLIVSQGTSSLRDKALVVRPNLGKKLEPLFTLETKISQGIYRLQSESEIEEALKIWDTEFAMADISHDSIYQTSCPGRHKESWILTGHVVPHLMSILSLLDQRRSTEDAHERKNMPRVVRVETVHECDDGSVGSLAAPLDLASSSSRNIKHAKAVKTGSKDGTSVVGQADVGATVAKELSSNGIYRGTIQKYKDDGMYDSEPGGTFFVRFTNGKKLKMGADRVLEAKTLFQTEYRKLVAVGISEEAASSVSDCLTSRSGRGSNSMLEPVLSLIEDEDVDLLDYEQKYELVHKGEVPSCIVGLEMPRNEFGISTEVGISFVPAWHRVLQGLACKKMEMNVESSREVYNLLQTESETLNGLLGSSQRNKKRKWIP